MKLHLGCGNDIWVGYVNVDREPYPGVDVVCDVFDLPSELAAATEIRAHHLLEHLPFSQSLEFAQLCRSRLRRGGELFVEVPDLEWAVANWLAQPEAEEWCDTSDEKTGRWNYALMTIFGNQDSVGEFHCTGFTERRLRALLEAASFREIQIDRKWNYDQMSLVAKATAP